MGAAALGLSPARAAPISSVVAFGDSLSDNGNLAALAGEPSAPYFNGRFSNGPVAVERLAAGLGVPLINFAVGGAMTGYSNLEAPPPFDQTGLLAQVDTFVGLLGGPADPSALYLVWAAPDDFFALRTNPALDPLQVAHDAIVNLSTAVTTLYLNGARQFLLPLMPDLGLTPEALAGGPVASGELSFLSGLFDALLADAYLVLEGQLPGADFRIFDTFSAQHFVVDNAAAFGLTNTDGQCYDGFVGQPSGNAPCANADEYFYWDQHHPTARIHQILGDLMLASLPVPGSLALLAAALVLLGAAQNRRTRLSSVSNRTQPA